MKCLKITFCPNQIKALLHKDVIIRFRQPWMTSLQLIWPCLMFMLLYLIRLKFGPQHIDDCQFPSRLLPTKNNVLTGFFSYICTIENKCMSTENYEETEHFTNAPMKPIIDITQIFINDDRMFNAVVELPEKGNFINAVTTLVTSGHFDTIRKNVEKVIALVPQVEKMLNGNFDIKKLFSERQTFVQGGYLLCGHPFPSTDSIPLVNDILYSKDFSKANQDELKVMPTNYCKKLYLDVTSSNHGKLTWSTIKPIIHGKILYGPNTPDTQSIMQFTNATFDEINRLKMLSVALEQILTKLRTDEEFQNGFNSLIKLAQSPFVRSLVGDDFDIDQIEGIVDRIRTDPIIYDVITTVKNILECFSVDRFVPVDTEDELLKTAYDLNRQRLFYAAVYFNKTKDSDVVYKFHMDTDNTQATFENRNRFWFPGPSRSMIRDLKYHRGFVQIKQSLDLAIIKHKKKKLRESGVITENPRSTTPSPFRVSVLTDDDGNNDDDEDDDWFTSFDSTNNTSDTTTNNNLISTFFSGLASNPQKNDSTFELEGDNIENADNDSMTTESLAITSIRPDNDGNNNESPVMGDIVVDKDDVKTRQKRQSILDFFLGGDNVNANEYEVDNLQFYTKQFPYPAYTHDDFKTGLYLAQAIQVAFFLGLVVEIAACVRDRIWMRESRNSMIMRSMGLKPCSEMSAWTIVTYVELLIIFVAVSVILYSGGILMYTNWIFIMIFLGIFGACLISFCYMCSTFFTSATIGAVAAALFFFISYCPYIIVLLFDTRLNSLQNFIINLSFTSAYSQAWTQIMRMELQETGLTFAHVFRDGLNGEFGFGLFMIVLDMLIYITIGYLNQRLKNDEFRFVEVQREDLDSSLGATMTNVSKIYNDDKIAVGNINLSFPKNQVTCLLGRNGAGKSTIIKMLTGQIVQTTGRVILSQAMTSKDEYDKVGVCSQDNILIPNLTAREHLEMYAKIKLKYFYKTEVEKTLKSLNFGKYESYQAQQLSGGYKRRLCVAISFIGSPNVVILDEPCNGVDPKARKDIWELIEHLRKGRAVVFATHFLDEAEYLSDTIVIMKNGKIIAKHNAESLKNHCTAKYEILMQCRDTQTAEDISNTANDMLQRYRVLEKTSNAHLHLEIPYDQEINKSVEFLTYLENLQMQGRIAELNIDTQNLEQLFKTLDRTHTNLANGHATEMMRTITLKKDFGMDMVRNEPLKRTEAVRELLWKRLVHFSRNYRMLLCVIVLPAIFELLAMWFVAYRVEDDFDKVISLSRNLYPHTTQLLSLEKNTTFQNTTYANLKEECHVGEWPCQEFAGSDKAFYWVLTTLNEYQEKRYGGYTFNGTKSIVWYNNKGYHAMMGWLNDLNTHYFQTEMKDKNYSITAYNEPWKLELSELSTSSILRQASDSCMALILLIAFSLVVAVAAVYLVNERMNGEKLQQKLCGVDFATYWGVAFIWDFMIILLAIFVCITIVLAFGMPVFVDRQQLWGVLILALFFGFACIPAVHVFEKLFTDSSMAIVSIFCMNIIIPLFTMAVIVLLGVIGDSSTWDEWRYFLNRLFLIFPQHALGDGLLEIVKNHMVALVFHRYDIDSYKNPINSDLLRPHLIALGVLGIFFILLNLLLESGLIYRWKLYICRRFNCFDDTKDHFEELKIVSIQNSLKRTEKDDSVQALKVDNLCKSYDRGQYAVRNVTFAVKSGECLGLLGKNGAGKSTIFKMLSGELQPSSGEIHYFDNEISYCPQTNTLDSLLTVKECIEFYGRLRRINDIPKFVSSILESFQLDAYSDVLVKNLSGGNRRKLTVATACCGRTSVVLMDEPTSDMDPVTRAIVYRTIYDLLAENRAMVLTSHSISEIDEICHRIAILKDGQLLTCSSPESLHSQYGGYYNVAVFCEQSKIKEMEKIIRQRLPQSTDVQMYAHSIKFSIKIATPILNVRENGVDVPTQIGDNLDTSSLTLAQLFSILESMSHEHNIDGAMRYAVNCCRLDAIFERILDSSEKKNSTNNATNLKNGSSSLGYVHNGYVETETVT